MRLQKLNRQQADQPQTGDDNAFAERRFQQPDSLQGDGAQHAENCLFVGDCVGNADAQIAWNRDDFRVAAVRENPVSDGKSGHVRSDFEHSSDVAITEGNRLIELVCYGFERGEESVRADFIQHLTDFLWLLPGLAQPARFAEFLQHPFGAGRNQRGRCLDQQTTGPNLRARHFDELSFASSE